MYSCGLLCKNVLNVNVLHCLVMSYNSEGSVWTLLVRLHFQTEDPRGFLEVLVIS